MSGSGQRKLTSVEDTPATASVKLWVAAVDVPDALVDIVGTWSRSDFSDITANQFRVCVHFQVPDTAGEKTSSNEVQEAGGNYKEDLDVEHVTAPIRVGCQYM